MYKRKCCRILLQRKRRSTEICKYSRVEKIQSDQGATTPYHPSTGQVRAEKVLVQNLNLLEIFVKDNHIHVYTNTRIVILSSNYDIIGRGNERHQLYVYRGVKKNVYALATG